MLFQQEQLIRKLAVILDVQDEDIIVEHLKEAGVGHRYTNYRPQAPTFENRCCGQYFCFPRSHSISVLDKTALIFQPGKL